MSTPAALAHRHTDRETAVKLELWVWVHLQTTDCWCACDIVLWRGHNQHAKRPLTGLWQLCVFVQPSTNISSVAEHVSPLTNTAHPDNKLARAKVRCVVSFPKFHYNNLLSTCCQLVRLQGSYEVNMCNGFWALPCRVYWVLVGSWTSTAWLDAVR